MLLNGILALLAIQLTTISAQTVSSTAVDNTNSNVTVLQQQPIDKPGMFICNSESSLYLLFFIYMYSWFTKC